MDHCEICYAIQPYHRLSTQQLHIGDSEMEFPTLLKRIRYGPFVTGAFLMGIVKLYMIIYIYYQFLSKTGVTQRAKPVQGASPRLLQRHLNFLQSPM